VWPTRLARHGKVLSARGDYSVRRAELAEAREPIDPDCPCLACRRYSLGYLRHLRVTDELLGMRLLSLHNLTYTLGLLEGARRAVAAGEYAAYCESVRARRRTRHSRGRLP
jgi:queuine tRNA-ribosyltransferase